MIKDKFKEIIKTGIHPPLKQAGFKKNGNHFIKKLDETQQVVTLQLSHGNSYEQIRFYFRCGILINRMKSEPRELKSEVFADHRFSIDSISDQFKNDQFDLNNSTLVKPIAENIKDVIESDLIPFFNQHQNESECIKLMLSQPGLKGDLILINYLCSNNKITDLENYVIRLTQFLKANKAIYNDPNIARKRVERYIAIINKLGKMNPEFKEKIENNWL